MGYIFKNYVFEGGGVKGLAYVGAIKVLERKGIHQNIKRVAGASVGAICALLVALNYTSDEMEEILGHLNLKKFMDDDWGFLRDAHRLMTEFGWHKGDYFEAWIASLIESKTGSQHTTFIELKNMKQFKDVAFNGTNLTTHTVETFCAETTPDMSIARAARIAMSLPLFFKAIRNEEDHIFVDGGLLDNYPIKIFDRKFYTDHFIEKCYYDFKNKEIDLINYPEQKHVFNAETLGFRLDSTNENGLFKKHHSKSYAIDNLVDYVYNVISALLESQQHVHLHDDDWHRTVYIDSLGIKTIDFDLTPEEKKALIASGERYTEKYFEWYDKNHSLMQIQKTC